MYRSIIRLFICISLILALFVSGGLAGAEEPRAAVQPSGEAMVLDLVLLRPLGIIATAVGSAVFVVSLPFSLPSGSADAAARELIGVPAKYTFFRPLGQIDGPSPISVGVQYEGGY
ncbi:MAG: hypothetical protein ACREUA_03955 [Burkholderiales bacterium]